MRICKTNGCGAKHVAKGYCRPCYFREKYYGRLEPSVKKYKLSNRLKTLVAEAEVRNRRVKRLEKRGIQPSVY